jgi:hypothetical protein
MILGIGSRIFLRFKPHPVLGTEMRSLQSGAKIDE